MSLSRPHSKGRPYTPCLAALEGENGGDPALVVSTVAVNVVVLDPVAIEEFVKAKAADEEVETLAPLEMLVAVCEPVLDSLEAERVSVAVVVDVLVGVSMAV